MIGIIHQSWVVDLWAALAKAQQLLLDQEERDYILSQVNAAKGWCYRFNNLAS